MKPKPTPAFSWEELDSVRANPVYITPVRQGGCTTREWAERYKISISRARTELERLVNVGALTCRHERVADQAGRSVKSRVFHPAKEGVCGGSTSAGSTKKTRRKRA